MPKLHLDFPRSRALLRYFKIVLFCCGSLLSWNIFYPTSRAATSAAQPEEFFTEVTCAISTHGRMVQTTRLVESIRALFPDVRILVGDGGAIDNSDLFSHDANVHYAKFEYDTGLSTSRNALVEMVRTPFTWVMDDDYVVTDKKAAVGSVGVLKAKLADIVGLEVLGEKPYFGNLVTTESYVYFEAFFNNSQEPEYVPTQRIMNFFIARTEILKRFRWEERLKLGEHDAFFASIAMSDTDPVKMLSRKSLNLHQQDTSDPEYVKLRGRGKLLKSLSSRLFTMKHGVPLLFPCSVHTLLFHYCGSPVARVFSCGALAAMPDFPLFLSNTHRQNAIGTGLIAPKHVAAVKCTNETSLLWFVHIPKTGGSAIEAAASQLGILLGACSVRGRRVKLSESKFVTATPEHCASREINPKLSDQAYDYFNSESSDVDSRPLGMPWHQVPSLFTRIPPAKHVFTVVRNPYDKMLSSFKCPWRGHSNTSEHEDPAVLNEFVSRLILDNSSVRATPQTKYLSWHGLQMDYILRHESLEKDLLSMLEKIDHFPLVLKPTNLGSGGGLTADAFNCSVLKQINERFERDFAELGYAMKSCPVA